MEGQKQEWSSAHAQLWKSFRSAQKKKESTEPNSNVTIETVTPMSSVFEEHDMKGREVTSSILNEVTNRTRLDESVFSEKMEDEIIGLIEDRRTDSSVRELLTTIIHLKNRVEKANKEAVYRQDSLMQAANEALFHLSGQKHDDISSEEMVTEGSEALGVIESRFFAVLIQIEKCKKAIKTIAEKNGLNNNFSGEASMRQMLDVLSSSKKFVSESRGVENEDSTILHQLMNILGFPSETSLDQAPDLTLKTMKELEFLRRENHTNSLLLLEYERAVMAKFAACGVTSPPTVEQEKTSLLSSGDFFSTHSDDQWIMNHLMNLVAVVMEVNKNFHFSVIPDWLMGGPTETSAEAILNYMRTSIDGAKEMLIILSRDVMEAKQSLLKMTQTLSGDDTHSSNETSLTVMKDKNFLDILHDVEHIVESLGERENRAKLPSDSSREKTLAMMMRIARWLPEKDQVEIAEMLNDVDSLTEYMEDAVRSLVMDSTVQDPLLLQVEKLNSQIARLMDSEDGAGSNILDEAALSSLVETANEVRTWAAERNKEIKRPEDPIIQESLHELAQLLPTGLAPSCSLGDVRIDPPVNNILDMVRLLKRRLEQWIQEQQKQQLSGANSRLEKTRVETIVRERSKQLVKIAKEILLGSGTPSEVEDILSALSNETVDGPGTTVNASSSNAGTGGPSSSVVAVFDDLEERLKLVKLRHHRLFQTYSADKVRLDNLIQSSTAQTKRFSRICASVAAICRLVGLDQNANRLEGDSKTEAASASSRTVLRPEQRKTHVAQPANEADILETLSLVEELLKKDTPATDVAHHKSELLRLKREEARWQEETRTFHQAMQMIVVRLAEAGRGVKHTLFMLGTDESAEDDVVESVIRVQLRRSEEEKEENNNDKAKDRQQQQQEANEEALAALLQKFGRWSTRLEEAMEDHLDTQQKLNKYFSDVHCFFRPGAHAAVVQNSTDENLIDIDSTLMQFADGILPALDRAINDAKCFSGNTNATESGEKGEGGNDDVRSKTFSMLLQDAPTNCVSPTDRRLVRLYEAVGKLRTVVDGLLSVRYLSIPSASRRRGGNAADELTFDDAWGGSYVELDLGKLRGTTATTTTTTDKGSRDAPTVSDDALFRTVEANIRSVHQALGKFSTNYKHAVILVHKDTDMVQQFVASMLEPYVELDVDRVFKQDPVVLKEMFTLLTERTTRQRGCYFFNRVGGEGPCLWATALEQLSLGFVGIIERLRKRTQLAMELRDIVDDVVDLCAMYVNWAEASEEVVASLCPLPKEVFDACVRENDAQDVEESPEQSNQQQQGDKKKVAKPPLPPNCPRAKVSHFLEDTTVLTVVGHMFKLAREFVKRSEKEGASSTEHKESEAANKDDDSKWKARRDDELQQLEEQLQVLREAAAVAEQHAQSTLEDCKRMERERDEALSEAAVSRAELRRWRRSYGIAEDEVPPPLSQQSPSPPPPHPAVPREAVVSVVTPDQHAPHSALETGSGPLSPPEVPAKDALLVQLAQSMKELVEELRGAPQRGATSCHPATTTATTTAAASAKVEGEFRDGRHPTTGGPHDTALRRQPRRNAPQRGSGLVRSPREGMGVAPPSRSVSPRSVSSLALPVSRRSSLSPPGNDTQSHNKQHLRKQPATGPDSALASYKAVVVSPKGPSYSSLARAHSNTASSDTRGLPAPRYQPNQHSGNFFNECEVCCRHHCSGHAKKSAVGKFAAASSRLLARGHQIATPAPRRPRVTTPSPRPPRHEERKMHTHHSQRESSPPARGPAWRSTSSTLKNPSQDVEGGAMRPSSAVREHSAAARYDEDRNHNADHRGRPGPRRSSHSLLSPSTSTVLSPESSPMDQVGPAEEQHQRHSTHGTASRSSKEMHGNKASSFGESLEAIGHHIAQRMSQYSAHHGETARRTAHRGEQPRPRPNSSTSKPGARSSHSTNVRSDAVRKLADIVSRTKINVNEEL